MAGRVPPTKEQCSAEDVPRIRADVVESAREWNQEHEPSWRFRHAIPAETNGWVYIGDHGALAVTEYWMDQYPDPTCGLTVRVDERKAEVTFTADLENKVDSQIELYRVDPRGERAGLVDRQRMFWAAAEWCQRFMQGNAPGELDLEAGVEPPVVPSSAAGFPMTACEDCEYTDVRLPGTPCPQCDDGTMRLPE